MSKQFEAVTIPKWGIEMTHGRVVSWCFAEGDPVAAGSALVEIETDKIVNSFEARVAGTLARILVAEGDELPVGALIGVLALGAYEPADLETFIDSHTAGTTGEVADDLGAGVANDTPETKPGAAKISPALIRKLDKAGLAPGDVEGSGPGGRILKDDVDRAIAAAAKVSAPDAGQQQGAGADAVGLSSVQRRVAQRLTDAQHSVPLFQIQRRVAMGDALAGMKSQYPQVHSAVTVLLLQAISHALTQHPDRNIQFDNDAVHVVAGSVVALAVARDDGAVAAPVITHVSDSSPAELDAQLKATVSRARRGTLTADDHQPAAITLSNLGMYGVDAFTAMVTPPQIMVLAVGAVQIQPVWCEKNQSFEAGHCLDITLGCDHRLVNGAQGAEFLRTIADYLASA